MNMTESEMSYSFVQIIATRQ